MLPLKLPPTAEVRKWTFSPFFSAKGVVKFGVKFWWNFPCYVFQGLGVRGKISPKLHVKNGGVTNGKLHANFTLLGRSADLFYFCKSIAIQMGAVSWCRLVVYILFSAKRMACFRKSIAIEMRGVSRDFSEVSGWGVDLTLLTQRPLRFVPWSAHPDFSVQGFSCFLEFFSYFVRGFAKQQAKQQKKRRRKETLDEPNIKETQGCKRRNTGKNKRTNIK